MSALRVFVHNIVHFFLPKIGRNLYAMLPILAFIV